MDPNFQVISVIIIVIGVIIIGVVAGKFIKAEEIKKTFTQEVKRENVPTIGIHTFVAHIRITYESGRLIRIFLIKGTTRKE